MNAISIGELLYIGLKNVFLITLILSLFYVCKDFLQWKNTGKDRVKRKKRFMKAISSFFIILILYFIFLFVSDFFRPAIGVRSF